MKTLEQLGISPTPWKQGERIPFCEDHIVSCDYHRANGTTSTRLVADCNSAYDHEQARIDARLIAAAPELYDALRMYQETFAEIRKSAWFLDANFHEIMSLNKVMTAADADLARATGESEVKNGER